MLAPALRRLVPKRYRHTLRRLALTPFRGDLDRLARGYRTDKSSLTHGYTAYYARHLPRRAAVERLLEIGIGGVTSTADYDSPEGGASLRMWQDYFHRAVVVGVDIHRKAVTGPRIRVETGSQDDPAFLAELVREHGPFDVVIDDGSHVGRHQQVSFEHLFAALVPGGVYVIEDLETAYRADYEGGPPGTAGTAASLLKEQVDEVLRRHWDPSRPADVAAVHVYDQIAFIVKRT